MQINKKYIISLCLILLLSLITFLITSIFYSSNKNIEAELFTIKKGQAVKEIALNLKKEGLIKNSYSFIVYTVLSRKYSKIQAGEYLVSSQMNIPKILSLFTNGETHKEKLTIIEGWDLKDIAEYFKEKNIATEKETYSITGNPTEENESININNYSFLKDKPNNLSLEGYLFPDTYYIEKGDNAEDIINKMLDNFSKKLTPDLIGEIKKQNKTIFEIITMASLIEKEVITLEDKKIVSGILWKRMVSHMRLQVDATILYVQGKKGTDIYTKDTQIDSPYNTYRNDGLPLGPISNPGMDSILAAIYPTKSAYYYYLSAPNKATIFSKTLEEHIYNKNKYLK
ncbi:MAG: endolytic transglycosylase MltG [Candidatus Paceibacterota bacterium]|jgi:UPF0755 protein